MAKHLFQKGNKAAAGPQTRAGRSPDWLIIHSQNAFDRAKTVDFFVKVILGEDIDQVINENGELLKVPASVRDRLRAGRS
jgi:hypothetical protein